MLALSNSFGTLQGQTPRSEDLHIHYKMDSEPSDEWNTQICKISVNTLYNNSLILTQSATTKPFSTLAGVEFIYDNLICKNTLKSYLINGWEIISTVNSYDTDSGAQYSNIIIGYMNTTQNKINDTDKQQQ